MAEELYDKREKKLAKFGSLEFYQMVGETSNKDSEFVSSAAGFTATFTFTITDRVNELQSIFMRFDDGKIVEVRHLKPGEKTDFALEGDYNIWTQVSKGELDGPTAIMTRQMRFVGSMGTIMRYGKAFKRLLEIMTKVPVEY